MCKNQKGFTLVELLVVIAIIGVLAAVAIPRLSGTTDNAKRAKIMADLKIINNAMEVYFAQTGSYPPEGTVDSNHPLVTSGLLASAPVPPRGPLDELPAVMVYCTDNAVASPTNEPNSAFVRGDGWWPIWGLQYLKNTKHW